MVTGKNQLPKLSSDFKLVPFQKAPKEHWVEGQAVSKSVCLVNLYPSAPLTAQAAQHPQPHCLLQTLRCSQIIPSPYLTQAGPTIPTISKNIQLSGPQELRTQSLQCLVFILFFLPLRASLKESSKGALPTSPRENLSSLLT